MARNIAYRSSLGIPNINPSVPFTSTIPLGDHSEGKVKIQGEVFRTADRFTINLQTGPVDKPRDDTGLHLSVRLNQGYIARNSYKNGKWEEEEGSGGLPIGNGEPFDITIFFKVNYFKIAINGEHFCQFPYRIPREKLTHLLIDGDVTLTIVIWDSPTRARDGEDSSSQTPAVQQTGSQGFELLPGQVGQSESTPSAGNQVKSGFIRFLESTKSALLAVQQLQEVQPRQQGPVTEPSDESSVSSSDEDFDEFSKSFREVSIDENVGNPIVDPPQGASGVSAPPELKTGARMGDFVQDELVVELECPICTNYMSPPIRQCATGHSICETCRNRLVKCALCQQPFTETRNITLESLAVKMRYPCIYKSAGCSAILSFTERATHELRCNLKGYKCPMERCNWVGKYEDIAEHWKSEKITNKPYGKSNICHTKIKPESYYTNIVNAYENMFWFKCKLMGGKIFWAVQFVGNEAEAENYFFEIEIFKPGRNRKKILLSDYCLSVTLENSQLFNENICPSLTFDTVTDFLGDDQLLIYYFRVNRNVGPQGAQSVLPTLQPTYTVTATQYAAMRMKLVKDHHHKNKTKKPQDGSKGPKVSKKQAKNVNVSSGKGTGHDGPSEKGSGHKGPSSKNANVPSGKGTGHKGPSSKNANVPSGKGTGHKGPSPKNKKNDPFVML